jgi:hypothetical protein
MQTLSRMYDDYADAASVVSDLEAAGIPHDRISLVANADAHGRSTGALRTADPRVGRTASGDSSLDPADRDDSSAGAGAKRGVLAGAGVGGVAGLLAGIGAIAIPGVGPVIAAGWLIATLAGAGAGAAGGGLIGALTGAGVSREEAETYHEGVRRGGSLVTVQAEDAEVARVQSLLDGHKTLGWQERRASYGSDWTGPTLSDDARPVGARPGVTGTPVEPPVNPPLGGSAGRLS